MQKDIYFFGINASPRRNINEDATPSLFTDEELRPIKIESKKDAEILLANSDATITKEQTERIKVKMDRLKGDIDYFISTYKWVSEESTIHGGIISSGKLFFLFNNLSYQLRDLRVCLSTYSAQSYLSIYNDLKAEIITEYNNNIKERIEALFGLGQESTLHARCSVDHIIINKRSLDEILRCLMEHPSEEVSELFSQIGESRFCEDVVFSPLMVFSFSELLPFANDIIDVIKEIDQQKRKYRTVEECTYLYDVLYERFQANHKEYKNEAEGALDCYLSDNRLERNVQNINKRKQMVVQDFKATLLGKIWDEYHYDKNKLVEEIVNAEAKREEFEEYFRYLIKIEYLTNVTRNNDNKQKEKSEDVRKSPIYALTDFGIKHEANAKECAQKAYVKAWGSGYMNAYLIRALFEKGIIGSLDATPAVRLLMYWGLFDGDDEKIADKIRKKLKKIEGTNPESWKVPQGEKSAYNDILDAFEDCFPTLITE